MADLEKRCDPAEETSARERAPRYRILGVKEVWLCKNNEITFYLLENNSYRIITNSYFLSEIDSCNLVTFVNRGLRESTQIIKADFIKQFY